jgi:hypothetical protein
MELPSLIEILRGQSDFEYRMFNVVRNNNRPQNRGFRHNPWSLKLVWPDNLPGNMTIDYTTIRPSNGTTHSQRYIQDLQAMMESIYNERIEQRGRRSAHVIDHQSRL